MTVLVQVIDAGRPLGEMSGTQLLDHVDLLARAQRQTELATLRAAAQFAVLHGAETLDPETSRLPGRERPVLYGGAGTPWVAEFAGAVFGARLGRSDYAGRSMIADALDLVHRLPRLWARVQADEVRCSYARLLARKTRELSAQEAGLVDAAVAESADGRVTWSRFEVLVEAAIKAADPVAAAAREAADAKKQFANATRSTENGMRGFYLRAHFAIIARLEATVTYIAEALGAMGDGRTLDERRVARTNGGSVTTSSDTIASGECST
ncbi:hypothetical protein, partial [Nocardia salmonicida]|uniref:hypothetical protein n=1 Tax=Nocardia salmonicida TaxID=53431 RepID=UPI0033E160A7